jgi:hypothetical protein
MSVQTAVALVLALASTTLVSLAYLRQHDAVASLPPLSLKRPIHSVKLILGNRPWLLAFGMETAGFLLYAVALGLASLALVQSVAAGGIGILAYVSARFANRRLSGRETTGVYLSVLGLVALAISLAGGSGEGDHGSLFWILIWLGGTAAVAALVLTVARPIIGAAAAWGIAGGLLFSIADVSTKLTTQGGVRTAFVVVLIAGYGLGTSFLQLGYQKGAALTVAGLAVLLTNAVPIAAGTIVLHEPVPDGILGVLRVLAFAAVSAGAFMLARPGTHPSSGEPAGPAEEPEKEPAPLPEAARP